jgi:hypothetical protein
MVTRMCLIVTLYIHCLSCSVTRKLVIETGFMCLPVCSLVTPRWSNRSIYTHKSRSYSLIQVEFNQILLFTNNLNCHETELCKLYVVVLKRKYFQLIYILFTYLFIVINIHRMEKIVHWSKWLLLYSWPMVKRVFKTSKSLSNFYIFWSSIAKCILLGRTGLSTYTSIRTKYYPWPCEK